MWNLIYVCKYSNQDGAIFSLFGKPLKYVDQFQYLLFDVMERVFKKVSIIRQQKY